MAFFDEPRASRGARTWRRLGHWLRREPTALIALWLLLIATSAVALAASAAAVEALERARDATSRTEISLFLQPDAPRIEAETLLTEVRSRTDVRSARLESKEDALAALAAAALVTPAVAVNPLPDAVVVALRWDAPGGAPSARFDAVARSLGAIAGVASVEYDRRWTTQLDRWSALAERLDRLVQPLAAAAAALTAFLAALLWGRSCRTASALASAENEGSDWVAAGIVGAVGGITSVAAAMAGIQAIVTTIHGSAGGLQPMALAAGPNLYQWTWAVAASIVAGSTIGSTVGALRQDRSCQ